MAFTDKRKALESRDADIDRHHGDSFRVYMRHKRQRLYGQFQDSHGASSLTVRSGDDEAESCEASPIFRHVSVYVNGSL